MRELQYGSVVPWRALSRYKQARAPLEDTRRRWREGACVGQVKARWNLAYFAIVLISTENHRKKSRFITESK